MIVYHGSNRNFKTLRISKSLVRFNSTLENEGLGIYFSTDLAIAESYGKYLYTLEINDKYFYDFRDRNTCKGYLNYIRQSIFKTYKVDIAKFLDLDSVVRYMHSGGIALSGVGRELGMQLDSNERWYYSLVPTTRNKIYKTLKRFDRTTLKAYMFTYSIKDCGVIKDVSEDIVRIVDKRLSH